MPQGTKAPFVSSRMAYPFPLSFSINLQLLCGFAMGPVFEGMQPPVRRYVLSLIRIIPHRFQGLLL